MKEAGIYVAESPAELGSTVKIALDKMKAKDKKKSPKKNLKKKLKSAIAVKPGKSRSKLKKASRKRK